MKVNDCRTPGELQNLALDLEQRNIELEQRNAKLEKENKLLSKQIIDEVLKNRELKQG